MNIRIVREATCAGDGVVEHSIELDMPEDATYMDLWDRIFSERFLPSVTGSNEVWVLATDYYFCIACYYTYTKAIRSGLYTKLLKTLLRGEDNFVLRYYKNPLAWKDEIVNHFHNDSQTICHEGWADEMIYCYKLMEK